MDPQRRPNESETYLKGTNSSPNNQSNVLSEDCSSEGLQSTVTPPYWQHIRAASRNSILSIGKSQPIRLEDNTEEPEGTKSPLWAKLVSINTHTIITGNVKGVGDYVVWICQVQTLDVGATSKTLFPLAKTRARAVVFQYGKGRYLERVCPVQTLILSRYSEFETLRHELASTFPRAAPSLPALPPKSILCSYRSIQS